MLKTLSAYGFCIAILQLLIACGPATETQTAPKQSEQTAKSEPAKEAKTLILAFGDSLYAGYGLAPDEGFVPDLQKALNDAGQDVKVHNAGVSGDTTAAGLRRMDFVLDSLPRKPDLAILGLGGNDLLRGLKPEETRANMDAMVKKLKDRDIPVLLTGMLAPPNLGKDFSDKFNVIYPALAKKYGADLYPFFMDGVVARPDLILPDGIHPNAAGIDVIVAKVAPSVALALKD
ncbi:arylesterase [Parasphingorhabdus halotolerans]|uniref:Arylesterase n=1 Tax=Parasphingorhabdus halotolerans TaxID=2725558 RepID=A0A6H2DKD5_9SPHN|nr:arylesterase [Parasphingorhabdus halotolerans]QJB68658.1 arylesterase [Parasphingorhabdus halotolerans]